MNQFKQIRILLNCLSIHPFKGSEWAVGWNFAINLAKIHDVTVTCPNWMFFDQEKVILTEIKKYPRLKIRFVFVPLTKQEIAIFSKTIEKDGVSILSQFIIYHTYKKWMKRAYLKVKEMQPCKNFDIIHQMTMTGFREPGYLYRLGIPYIWGPIGGMASIPLRFLPYMDIKTLTVRGPQPFINYLQIRFGRARFASKKADIIYAIGPEEERVISQIWKRKCRRLIETGTSCQILPRERGYNNNRPLIIGLTSGHGDRRKGIFILIKAIAGLKGYPFELKIAGEGVETKYLKKLVKKKKLDDKVQFVGNLAYSQISDFLYSLDVFIHPSFLDGTPHSVIEALSSGLPVICHDIRGLNLAVTDKCGLKIPLTTVRQSVEGIRSGIRYFIQNPEKVNEMSKAAIKRSSEITWLKLTEEITKGYVEVVKRS